jgi:hypothetical protein
VVTEAEIFTRRDALHAAAHSNRGGGGLYDVDIFSLNLRADGFPNLIAVQTFVDLQVGP